MLVIDPDGGRYNKHVGIEGHASEAELKGIPNAWFNEGIVNDKTKGLESLKSNTNHLAKRWGF